MDDDLVTAVNRLVTVGMGTHRVIGELLGMHPTDLAAVGHLSAEGAMTQEQLRRRLRLGKGSMTALVKRLVAAGRIERRQHPSDGRAVLLAATPATVAARRAARRRMDEAIAAAAARLGPAERASVAAFLADAAEAQGRALADLLDRD